MRSRVRSAGRNRGPECRNGIGSTWAKRSSAFLKPVGARGVSSEVLPIADDACWGARVVLLGIFESAGHTPVDSWIWTHVFAVSWSPAVSTCFATLTERGAPALGSVILEPEGNSGAVKENLDSPGGS